MKAFDPYTDLCPFCLEELRRGVPADGKCGHEKILEEYPHLRFNARDRLSQTEYVDSIARFQIDHPQPKR